MMVMHEIAEGPDVDRPAGASNGQPGSGDPQRWRKWFTTPRQRTVFWLWYLVSWGAGFLRFLHAARDGEGPWYARWLAPIGEFLVGFFAWPFGVSAGMGVAVTLLVLLTIIALAGYGD